MKKKILYICGSLNQTTMMHQISMQLNDMEAYFTPFYGDKFISLLAENGLLDFTILGGRFKQQTMNYLTSNNLKIDYRAQNNDYDLVFTCTDLIVPQNVRNKKLILIQEGMTDPENIFFHLVKWFKLPRYLASTSATGLSDLYDYFCVASEGYRDLFIGKGVNPEKIKVTGIPNFDNVKKYLVNEFPYKNFVLVATSDARETFKYEDRKSFILKAKKIAGDRKLIFKLHPNENFERAINEINTNAPGSIVYTDGNINEMIANCDVLITKYSSVVYIGLALGKEVYSDFDLEQLKRLTPIQNDGTSAINIANLARELLEKNIQNKESNNFKFKLKIKPKSFITKKVKESIYEETM